MSPPTPVIASSPSDTPLTPAVNPDAWPKPNANFPIASCYNDFGPHKIIFDITLCGDWAGNTYNESGCNKQYPACSYQVGYNGSSFNRSYWEVESLRLFTQGGDSANAANSPQSAASHQSATSSASLGVRASLAATAAAVLASLAFAAAL